MPGLEVIATTALCAVGLVAGVWYWKARARREARDTEALELAKEENRHIPASLHPVIDPDICIGSFSCLKVCPEGDILGAVAGKAALINATHCIGHGKCALECPVDAIKLVFGSSERGVDLPEVDEFFQSSRKGVHIIGELGGMGLVKNAMTQGIQLAEHFGKTMKPHKKNGVCDVAIVGAGPAGMAMALGLRKAGLSFRLLERGEQGGTIASYPRHKLVMTEKVDLPLFGKFGKPIITKEELLELWSEALAKGKVQVEGGMQVKGIAGADGAFELTTNQGAVQARKVALAIGRRGTPRKLGCPGEDLPKVVYSMIDPEQYEGSRVLVVGGGDSALEAAIQLVEETDAEVVLSYRKPQLEKARAANKRRVMELIEEQRLHSLMPSTLKHIERDSVLLDHAGREMKLRNDFIIACLGGELPSAFLKENGIDMKAHFGEEKPKAKRGSAIDEPEPMLPLVLFTIGVFITALLFVAGWHYYQLPLSERRLSPSHQLLRPAGLWGHGLGIAATLVMMSNFFYAVRKRVRAFKGAGSIRNWFTVHQFVGFMSPIAIGFHSAFQSNNTLATGTASALGIVVLTGVIGRYIYMLVPSSEGRAIELGELTARWERLKIRIEKLMSNSTDAVGVKALIERAATKPEGSLLGLMLMLPFMRVADAAHLRTVRSLFAKKSQYHDFVSYFHRMRALQVQVGFFKSLKRLMSVWRVLHVVLAVLLVVLIGAHITLSLYLGYTWLFR